MNALTPIDAATALPDQIHPDDAVAAAAAHRRQRHDGWTPDRQRVFLESVADGHTMEVACRLAGMSPSSAYAFRRRAAGAAFDLGWRAASLLARDRVADALLARAIDGQRETITRPNGDVIERHRFDNRLAGAMLARLDRMAEASDPASAAANASARLVAAEFDGFLDLIEAEAGPARAGLFVAARAPQFMAGAAQADLAPILSLARADRYLRTGAGGAGEVDTAGLDPAARATWTAEQWTRAEAAGLVALAPPATPEPEPEPAPEPTSGPPLSPLHPVEPETCWEDGSPVWFDQASEEWRTAFPPPPGFDGDEEGEFGDFDYSRELTDAERALAERERQERQEDLAAEQARHRDRWFGRLARRLDAGRSGQGGEAGAFDIEEADTGTDPVSGSPQSTTLRGGSSDGA